MPCYHSLNVKEVFFKSKYPDVMEDNMEKFRVFLLAPLIQEGGDYQYA